MANGSLSSHAVNVGLGLSFYEKPAVDDMFDPKVKLSKNARPPNEYYLITRFSPSANTVAAR